MNAPMGQPTRLSDRLGVGIWQVPIADFQGSAEGAEIEIYETPLGVGVRPTRADEAELAALTGVVALRLVCSIHDVRGDDIVEETGPGPEGAVLASIVATVGSGALCFTSERLLGVMFHSIVGHGTYEVEVGGSGDGLLVAFSIAKDALPAVRAEGGLVKTLAATFASNSSEGVMVNLEDIRLHGSGDEMRKAKKQDILNLAHRFGSSPG